MRTIRGIDGIAKDLNFAKFPDSAIVNETSSQEGTPVIREIYNDFLVNIYKFIRDRGEIPNQLEDNEVNGYQFFRALKNNASNLDIVNEMFKDENHFRLNVDFSMLPNRYVVFAKTYDDYFSADDIFADDGYYDFETKGFKAGDELLLYKDDGDVVHIISLTSTKESNIEYNAYGIPLAYCDISSKMTYHNGRIVFEDFKNLSLDSVISTLFFVNIEIVDVIFVNGWLVSLCAEDGDFNLYHVVKCRLDGSEVQYVNLTISDLTNQLRLIGHDNGFFLTHAAGRSEYAYSLRSFDVDGNILIDNIDMSYDFLASSNCFFKENYIYMPNYDVLMKFSTDGSRDSESIGMTAGYVPNLYRKGTIGYIQFSEIAQEWI